MKTSEQTNELATAMARAQAEMKPAIKDSLNPAFRSKYADLTSVWEACRPALCSNGLTVWQDVTTGERGIAVVTRITHASGQWVEFGPLTVPCAKQDAHGVGSATSYAKRYALSAAVGVVAEEDDDGNAAQGDQPEPSRRGRPNYRKGYDVPKELQERAEARTAGAASPTPDRLGEAPPAPAASLDSERQALLLKVKKVSTALGLTAEDKRATWGAYCERATPDNVDPAALQDLLKYLELRAEQKGLRVEGAA